MKINGTAYRTIWLNDDGWSVEIIDQTKLPHELVTARLATMEDAAVAIRTMQVRGAPLIGATAAYGVCLALREDTSDEAMDAAIAHLAEQRPTAVNLRWALEEIRKAIRNLPREERVAAAYRQAATLCDEDIEACRMIGIHGLRLIEEIAAKKELGDPVNVLTHCNAGWIACVDWGTATSPIYQAHDKGIAMHVWVDETRPRNQGASLTAYELGAHGVPHTIVVDNHLYGVEIHHLAGFYRQFLDAEPLSLRHLILFTTGFNYCVHCNLQPYLVAIRRNALSADRTAR